MTRRDQRSAEAEAWRRWYWTARWRRIASHHKRNEPLCRMCKANGLITIATECDHVVPHKGDPELFWNGELQSLCRPCHARDKQGEEARGYSSAVDADGFPMDPRHPFNAPRSA